MNTQRPLFTWCTDAFFALLVAEVVASKEVFQIIEYPQRRAATKLLRAQLHAAQSAIWHPDSSPTFPCEPQLPNDWLLHLRFTGRIIEKVISRELPSAISRGTSRHVFLLYGFP